MCIYALPCVCTDFRVFSYEKCGEGGIRTLGSLLGYGALAKRCFQPLSHLTNAEREYRGELQIANTDIRHVVAISSGCQVRVRTL